VCQARQAPARRLTFKRLRSMEALLSIAMI
jgi:hypothetical protein